MFTGFFPLQFSSDAYGNGVSYLKIITFFENENKCDNNRYKMNFRCHNFSACH
jgi:hypothetical protein